MRLLFEVKNTSLKGLRFETDKDEIRVGRSRQNDLVLRQRSVSRHHADILLREGVLTVEDRDSHNLTKVDGEAVDGPTELCNGSVILFGDVTVALTFPDLAEDDEDAEITPEAGIQGEFLVAEVADDEPEPEPDRPRPGAVAAQASLAGIVSASDEERPGSAGEAGRYGALGPLTAATQTGALALADGAPTVSRRVWPLLTVVLGGVLCVALVAYMSSRTADPPPFRRLGVTLSVGDERLVQVPWGYAARIVVDDPSYAEVRRVPGLEMAVEIKGVSDGSTEARLWADYEQAPDDYMALNVTVLVRPPAEVAEEARIQKLSDRECIAEAEAHIRQGDRVNRESKASYEALVEYRRALRVLDRWKHDPNAAYNRALDRRDAAEKAVRESYQDLLLDMSAFFRDGDYPMALRRLDQIKMLITDEDDLRRQNAVLLSQILQDEIERERRRSRRGG